MIKILLLFLAFPLISCSQKLSVISQGYNFLAVDGEIGKLKQSSDTLYQLKCYIDRPCQPRPSKHSKILSVKKVSEFLIVKLERLDTIPLSINPYPATRFSVLIIKRLDENQIGILPLRLGLTKSQLDTVVIKPESLKEKFFLTFYSDKYLKQLSLQKKVTTKSEALEIINDAKADKFKELGKKYMKTRITDLYASGLSAEILNRACLDKGFSPVGAGRAISRLMRN